MRGEEVMSGRKGMRGVESVFMRRGWVYFSVEVK
jgi:hypothetical protein